MTRHTSERFTSDRADWLDPMLADGFLKKACRATIIVRGQGTMSQVVMHDVS